MENCFSEKPPTCVNRQGYLVKFQFSQMKGKKDLHLYINIHSRGKACLPHSLWQLFKWKWTLLRTSILGRATSLGCPLCQWPQGQYTLDASHNMVWLTSISSASKSYGVPQLFIDHTWKSSAAHGEGSIIYQKYPDCVLGRDTGWKWNISTFPRAAGAGEARKSLGCVSALAPEHLYFWF